MKDKHLPCYSFLQAEEGSLHNGPTQIPAIKGKRGKIMINIFYLARILMNQFSIHMSAVFGLGVCLGCDSS